MAYLLGTILAFLCLRGSLYFLDQSFALYFDDVAITMVVGGTIAVAIISLPWHNHREIRRSLKAIFFHQSTSHKQLVLESLDFIRSYYQGQITLKKRSTMASDILHDGRELLDLQFQADDIATILDERLHQYVQKKDEIAEYFTSLAKYPPAFGLIGTVLGLVNLMRAITEGLDPAQTGAKMALALVATLYGLVFANFFVAPIGESLARRVQLEKFQGEVAVQAVLLAAEGTALLKSQEMLNSFVSKQDRVNITESLTLDVDEAA
ncbi:MAG: motility protein A [Oligoflexus sp.]